MDILPILKARFDDNMARHARASWSDVATMLTAKSRALAAILAMEETGGEPDVVDLEPETSAIWIADCSKESPAGRRSLCYDRAGLESRRDVQPVSAAIDHASEMGVKLMTEEQYFRLQALGEFDLKTSSWLATPADLRGKGGALFGDRRYGRVFIYHNGAQSFYAARGYRAVLQLR